MLYYILLLLYFYCLNLLNKVISFSLLPFSNISLRKRVATSGLKIPAASNIAKASFSNTSAHL